MTRLYQFFFSVNQLGRPTSILILILRIFFGIMFMTHGIEKWAQFNYLSHTFPDPLGIGSQISLVLAICAELFCSIFFIFGFLYKFTLLPMIFTMIIAFFAVHHASIAQGGELSFIYLIIFVVLLLYGPGRLSFDYILSKKNI